jgi:Prophage minor tail protein Z (GPZ)
MVTIEARQMKQLQKALVRIKNGVPRVLVPAVNRSLASGQTAVRREIRKIYTIKQKDIPTKLHRARYASPEGHIRIDQGMLGVDKFTHRPMVRTSRRRDLFVQIKKGKGGFVKRGFVTNRIGYGPFQRRSAAPRLPIRKLIAIGAPIMASQPTVGPAANKVIGDTLAKRIDHELKRVLASAGGRT